MIQTRLLGVFLAMILGTTTAHAFGGGPKILIRDLGGGTYEASLDDIRKPGEYRLYLQDPEGSMTGSGFFDVETCGGLPACSGSDWGSNPTLRHTYYASEYNAPGATRRAVVVYRSSASSVAMPVGSASFQLSAVAQSRGIPTLLVVFGVALFGLGIAVLLAVAIILRNRGKP